MLVYDVVYFYALGENQFLGLLQILDWVTLIINLWSLSLNSGIFSFDIEVMYLKIQRNYVNQVCKIMLLHKIHVIDLSIFKTWTKD